MNAEFGQIEGDSGFESWLPVREIVAHLLGGWKIILVCALASLLWTVYQVHRAIPIYQAQMIVTPVQLTPEEATASRINGALGNLANLAGIPASNNQLATQFRLYVDSMASRDLGEDLARDKQLMHTLFAGEWDAASQIWRQPDRDFANQVRRTVYGMLGYPQQEWTPPDGARMQQFLTTNVHVDQDPRKAYLVTISYASHDTDFAVRFLRKLNAAADNHLRQKALTRARQYIRYLSDKLDTVTIADHRAAIMATLSDQEKYEMVASSAAPFAADMFDAPSASQYAISPQPRRLYMVGLLKGLVAGAVLAFVWGKWGAQIRRRIQAVRG